MPNYFSGNTGAVHGRFAIAVSRFNESITKKLLDAAVETLVAAGVADESIDVFWTPGAFELPLIVDQLAEERAYSAVLCLGAVIRGETTHDQHINRAVSLAIMESSVRTGVPILFGLLTCENLEQAIHRAGGNVGNKGAECATAAIEMARLLAKLPDHKCPLTRRQ